MQMNIENNAHMKGLQAIEQAKKNMGAEDFVANMGILMLGNIPQMGSILKSGFKVSRMTEKKLFDYLPSIQFMIGLKMMDIIILKLGLNK